MTVLDGIPLLATRALVHGEIEGSNSKSDTADGAPTGPPQL